MLNLLRGQRGTVSSDFCLSRQSQLADMREEVSSKPSLGRTGSWYFLVSRTFYLPATRIDGLKTS
jgi:hypothetical protein